MKAGTKTEVAEYKGFLVLVEKNFMGEDCLVMRGRMEYRADMSTSPVGCMTKIENLFNGMQAAVGFLEEKLEKYRLDMEQAKLEYEKPFQYEAELKAKLARQFELNNLLDLENQASKEEEQEPEVSRAAEPSHGYGKEREGNR